MPAVAAESAKKYSRKRLEKLMSGNAEMQKKCLYGKLYPWMQKFLVASFDFRRFDGSTVSDAIPSHLTHTTPFPLPSLASFLTIISW